MLRRAKDKKIKPPERPDPLSLGIQRCWPEVRLQKGAAFQWRTSEQLAADPTLSFNTDNPEGKIYLGMAGCDTYEEDGQFFTTGGSPVGIKDDRPVCLFAGSRAGKGRSWLINVLSTYPGPAIVIDSKMGLAEETAVLRARRFQQRVGINAPDGIRDIDCIPYLATGNPMQWHIGDDDDAMIRLAMLMAEGGVVRDAKSDSHFEHRAMETAGGMFGLVAADPAFEGKRDFNTFYELMAHGMEDGDADQGEPSTLEEKMCDSTALDGFVAAAGAMHFDTPDRERGSITSTLRRHFGFLRYPRIRRALSTGPFDPRPCSMYDPPTTLYTGLNIGSGKSSAGFLRMFLNTVLAAYEADANRNDFQHHSGRLPTLLLIDECFALGRLELLEVAAGIAAGFGLKLITVWQGVGQIKTLYPKTWETFLNGTSLFFGNQDLETTEYLERRLGKTYVQQFSRSDPGYDAAVKGGATGSSYSMNLHPVLTGREVAELFKREDPSCRCLAFTGAHGPMILQRAAYDKHPLFKGIFDAHR